MVVQEGEEPPRLVDVQQPLEKVLDRQLLQRAFISPERRFLERIQRSREALRARLLAFSVAGLVLVILVFAAVSYQFGRIQHLEAQMRRQRQLAYLGTLAGGLAHEIRNPLNGITLNLHLLEETLGGADERLRAQSSRFLGRIKPALGHLERIVTEFLEFARPRPLDLATVSLGELARQVVEFLEPDARARGLQIRLRVDESAGASEIQGDRERLRQVFLNLVANAFQAVPAGGLVEVEVVGGPAEVTLRVRDDGPGVPEGQDEEIFRLFFTTRAGGVGLGLPIVRRVVEDHRGEVGLERGPGPGACFRVRLPRVR
jgi:signal transduction histidine kinase